MDYFRVARSGGAGDKGLVMCFATARFCRRVDNYQCKRYDHPLMPSEPDRNRQVVYYTPSAIHVAWKYYFACSKGIGTTLSRFG